MDWRAGLRAWAVGLAAAAVLPGVAAAHEVAGTRFESPIPLPYLLAGAGATVAVTALWLGRTSDLPTGEAVVGAVSAGAARWLRGVAVALFSVAVVASVVTGVVGPQAAAENVGATFVWGLWFEGVALLAILLGSPWRALSPWRNLHRALSALEGEELALRAYPERLGVWPAVVAFVAVLGLGENVLGLPRSPRATAGVVAGLAAVLLVGGVVFGRDWFAGTDPFAVLYRLFGRVSPVAVTRAEEGGYRVALRPPYVGCLPPVTRRGAVAFVVTAVYTVSFDGFTATPEYQTLLFGARDVLGTGTATAALLYLLGLGLFVASFVAIARVADRVGGAGGGGAGGGEAGGSDVAAAAAFAPTVVPIAAAYEFAHYYPFVVRSFGRVVVLSAGLVGVGMDSTLLAWLSLPLFWGSQVFLVVAGHVVAVVAAHGVAVDRYGDRARRGHLPLVALMVGYTVLSLWIISRPVVG